MVYSFMKYYWAKSEKTRQRVLLPSTSTRLGGEVQHIPTASNCVVKRIWTQEHADTFLDEGMLLRQLSKGCTCITRCVSISVTYDILWQADRVDIVMERANYVWKGRPCPDLARLRHFYHCDNLFFSSAQLGIFLHTILYVLDHIHCHGILHRDIKLENILCFENGTDFPTLKLTDFEYAIPVGSRPNDLVTQTGWFRGRGSSLYQAPEVAIPNDWVCGTVSGVPVSSIPAYSPESDLFAVGACAVYLFSSSILPIGLGSIYVGGHLECVRHRNQCGAKRELNVSSLAALRLPTVTQHTVSSGIPQSFSNLVSRLLDPIPKFRPSVAQARTWLDNSTQPLAVNHTYSQCIGHMLSQNLFWGVHGLEDFCTCTQRPGNWLVVNQTGELSLVRHDRFGKESTLGCVHTIFVPTYDIHHSILYTTF